MAVAAFIVAIVGFLGLIGTLIWVPKAKDDRIIARIIFGVVSLAGLIVIISCCFTVVPAGHVGVTVVFGSVNDKSVPEGLHLINPFASVSKMSVRTETYTMSAIVDEGTKLGNDGVTCLSKDGLKMPLDITVVYRLVPSDAPWIYQNIGSDYEEKVIRPSARTAIREAASTITAQEAYSSKRKELATKTEELLTQKISSIIQERGFNGKGFIIQQLQLRDVELPSKVKNAIEDKLAAEQEAQRMEFVLAKERKEAERKEIEANGIQKFQEIVMKGISDQLLQWRGIEATTKLAESNNAKIVIIGGKDGLPIILNAKEK